MRKTIKKVFKITILTFVIFAISVLLISWHVTTVGRKYITTVPDMPNGDAILVLGAFVHSGGNVSVMLGDRLDFAIKLYNQKAAPKIIVSGDHGRQHYDEVNAMRQYLLDHGIPGQDIFMDHAGFNTYNSLYRAEAIFCVTKLIVVSQEYHVIRANYIGKMLGLDISGVGADTQRYPHMTMYELREYGSRYKAFLECLFRVKPTYLGERIPIWGNGEMTLDS